MEVPEALRDTIIPELKTPLPEKNDIHIDPSKKTLIYNYYNLDPHWHEEEDVNRVLLLEPSVFEAYPISQKSLNLALKLAEENISNIQVYVGEFEELKKEYHLKDFLYKEHPLNQYSGTEEPRDWMFSVTGYFRSFFAFWKKCQKELPRTNQ